MAKVRDLGPLHALISRGLPDWHDKNGKLESHKLAEHLGISYQALYKIYDRERITMKRITPIIALSESMKREGFTPLTIKDFHPFL